jgi:hypothetical protein
MVAMVTVTHHRAPVARCHMSFQARYLPNINNLQTVWITFQTGFKATNSADAAWVMTGLSTNKESTAGNKDTHILLQSLQSKGEIYRQALHLCVTPILPPSHLCTLFLQCILRLGS